MIWDAGHMTGVCPERDPSLMGRFRNIIIQMLILSHSAQTVMVIRLTQMTACITRVLVAMAKLAVLGWLPW